MGTSLELIGRGLTDVRLYALLIQAVFSYVLPYWFQRELLARMPPRRREAAWNGLSWACAIIWNPLHPALSMIPFAWVTRPQRGAKPGTLAILWGILLAAIVLALDVALAWLFEVAGLG